MIGLCWDPVPVGLPFGWPVDASLQDPKFSDVTGADLSSPSYSNEGPACGMWPLASALREVLRVVG